MGDYLHYSDGNIISGNTFTEDGLKFYDSWQNTVIDNAVNGKPLIYLEDESNSRVEDGGPCDPCELTATSTTTTIATSTTSTTTASELPEETTTTTIEVPEAVGRVVGFTAEGVTLLGFLIFLLLAWYIAYKRRNEKHGAMEKPAEKSK